MDKHTSMNCDGFGSNLKEKKGPVLHSWQLKSLEFPIIGPIKSRAGQTVGGWW